MCYFDLIFTLFNLLSSEIFQYLARVLPFAQGDEIVGPPQLCQYHIDIIDQSVTRTDL